MGLSQGPEVGGAGLLQGPTAPEMPVLSPEMRETYERGGGGIPIGGAEIIRELQLVEIDRDADELRKVVNKALAFREGLEFGITGGVYELKPDSRTSSEASKIAKLEKMLITVEGATARNQSVGYIDIAIDEAISAPVRRVQEWREDREKWREKKRKEYVSVNRARERMGRTAYSDDDIANRLFEEEVILAKESSAIPELVRLANHVHARRVFDMAFIHRMQTCEDPGRAAKLGIELASVSPDSPHWISLFQGEFGELAEQVFEEMVKFGLPDEVIERLGLEPLDGNLRNKVPVDTYAQGFTKAETFGYWFKHLYEKSGSRIDIVWNAWKVALITEVIDKLGESKNSEGVPFFADPPLGNALFTFTAHLKSKRKLEYGFTKPAGGRSQVEKLVSHSGLPMSINEIGNLCESYLDESKIKFDKDALERIRPAVDTLLQNVNQIPLDGYDHTMKTGGPDYYSVDQKEKYYTLQEDIKKCLNGDKDTVKIPLWDLWLYGRMRFSNHDPNTGFPWFQTESGSIETPGELPPGSFGGWQLTRYRAFDVLTSIRSRPSMSEMKDADFFASKLRNWVKVFGKIEPDAPAEENPRAWITLGWLYYHMPGTGQQEIPAVKGNPEAGYRTKDTGQTWENQKAGLGNPVVTNFGDILVNAEICGWLRPKDSVWVQKKLGTEVPK